jgi:hypothetical protein
MYPKALRYVKASVEFASKIMMTWGWSEQMNW